MRIVTGIQPSGKLHIGNYFGAIQPALALQAQGEAFFFVADYHAMTSTHHADVLKSNIQEVVLDWLACGLDPEKVTFFRQSAVPEVHELAWLLSTLCPMSLLEKCHSYKDKTAKGIAANHALFSYPVLMAADILLYRATQVPVGKDQKQHVEVTRDLAIKFNETYGAESFTLPNPLIQESTAIVVGLDGQKMSKSYHNTLPIFGDEKALKKLIMRIPTDSSGVEDPKPTDNSIILQLYRLFAHASDYEKMLQSHHQGGIGYGEYKKQLAEAYWDFFQPMREKRNELSQNPSFIQDILSNGAQRARKQAQETLSTIRQAVGL